MSFARKLQRQAARKQGAFANCPKCHAKLIEKHGYGLVCDKCGYIKPQKKAEDTP